MVGRRSGDGRAGGEVGVIAECDLGDELTGTDETALQFRHARGGDEIARGETVACAEGGGEADGLPLCAQVAMTRVEPKAMCVALVIRPARKRLVMLRE